MAGLEDVRFLRHLCLYSNEITKIEHLDHLTDLELLWLNDNNISVIEVFVFTISCHCHLYTNSQILSRYLICYSC